jgi:methyltransferase of FxLD system
VARAAGVLNFAALIASDSGIPKLATDLCWRQHEIFADAGTLPSDIAVIALMPLVNIARQQARQGDGNTAYRMLSHLYRAAQQRGTATVHGHRVSLAPLTHGPAHREACKELWAVLLTDGARALAREGRWTDAAEIMAAHHGIGTRLLDGRQVKIMALLEQGLHRKAAAMIDATAPAEPWEAAVAAILRAYCQQRATPSAPGETGDAVAKTLELIGHGEPTTAAFRSRAGLTALDLAANQPEQGTAQLRDAIVKLAATDAYAARNALGHSMMRARMTCHQERQLTSVVAAAGLGAGYLPPGHMDAFTAAVGQAEEHLRTLLRSAAPGRPLDGQPGDAARKPDSGTAVAARVGPVTPTASLSEESRAGQLRNALADHVKSFGIFQTPQVEAAFRTVPRHLFLPAASLDDAYSRNPVVTRRAPDGTSLSSASSPKLVAAMLEQLSVAPGQRVLEIGAATGFNAALLAELTGPAGTVVTIELDEDLADEATANLRRAGYPGVRVACGDGARGEPGQAPYDRIIVTAEAWDLVPAWWDQLAPNGRIVVPVRLHGSGLTRSIGFRRSGPDTLASTSAAVCGFVPMRGISEHAGQRIHLAGDAVLNVDAADLPDAPALAQALGYPAAEYWAGIPVRHDEPAEHLDLWLATTTTGASFSRLTVTRQARDRGLANPAMRWAGASLYQGGTLAYITARPIDDSTNELGVTVHGPASAKLAPAALGLLQEWHRQRPAQPAITACRNPASPGTPAGTVTPLGVTRLPRPHSTLTIAW